MNDQRVNPEEMLSARARQIDLAHHGDFDLGKVSVQPSLRRINGPAGSAMLEPKVMQVLAALADPVGSIMSRDDLIERCWDGRIVGDTSINRVISLLRSGLKEVAGDSVVVENVPKVGYRLLVADIPDAPAPVRQPEAVGAKVADHLPKDRRWLFGVGALALTLLLAAFFLLRPAGQAPIEDVRIVMLPLESGEAVDPIYASGLEAELRGAFAKVGAMEVTTSESAQMLLDEGIAPAEIGSRLDAQFVWIGDFEAGVERSTLSFRMIDVASGNELFSETLQSAPDEAEYLPFRAARAVTTALNRPVRGEEIRGTVSGDDFRLYLVAIGLLKTRDGEKIDAALEILQQITTRNPDFAHGWGALSKAQFLQFEIDPEKRAANTAKAIEIANHAIEIEADSVEALKVLGLTAKDADTASGFLGRAVELDPGDTEAWFWHSVTQLRFILEGGDPLSGAIHMIRIDPLWPASWTGSGIAAQFGKLEVAKELEAKILAAAITPSQRLFAEARLARLEGDLSTYLRKAREASRSASETERLWGFYFEHRFLRILLGMPNVDGTAVPRQKAPASIMDEVDLEVLPARNRLRDSDLIGAGMWDDLNYVRGVLPLYLQYDRESELLSDYDARFSGHADFLEFAEQSGEPERVIPDISVYMVLALRRAGREMEAAQHLASLEKVITRWRDADLDWIEQKIILLEYAALIGDDAAAVELVESLPRYGWPYTVSKIDPTIINLLRGDPLFDKVRNLPEVRAVIEPINARLKAERSEIEALEL